MSERVIKPDDLIEKIHEGTIRAPYVKSNDPKQWQDYGLQGPTDLRFRPGDLVTRDMLHGPDRPVAASGAMREKLNALPYDLVPHEEMVEAYVRVAEFGAVKYAPWNWSKGLSRVQLLGSLLRHAWKYLRGEDYDPESGLLHTDHILWNAVSLSHNVRWGLEDGRRPEPPRDYKVKK